jgi:hypothetical protein
MLIKFFIRHVIYDVDVEDISQNVPKVFIFSSPEGHTLFWLILGAPLLYEPHDFSDGRGLQNAG